MKYRIELVPFKDGKEERYVIIDEDGMIINDANGYGFKTKELAKKGLLYLLKYGKQNKK